MAEKKMIIDGIECPFTNERNVLEVARNNGIDIPSLDRKSTRLNSSHPTTSRMPSSA